MSDSHETSGIRYQASLPLSWHSEPVPSNATLASRRYANIALLRGLATLESSTLEHEHEPDSHMAKTLERLESKLDIALSMLARVTMQNVQLPPPMAVTLSARAVEWVSDQALPAVAEHVLISLYLSPHLPEPLQLHARVVHASQGRCVALLQDEDEEFDEWMTRTLFRYHRRGLQARRGQ